MRRYATSYGIGSKWNIHAEGTVDRPKYSRWGANRRADIVVIDHDEFLRWWRGDRKTEPPYVAMIELKVIWPGVGRKFPEPSILEDIKKLDACVRSQQTLNAYLVLLDGLDRYHRPYYSPELLRRLKDDYKVWIFHWPDGDSPIEDIRASKVGRY